MTENATTKQPATSIAPMLSVRKGAKAIDFYKSAFGATETFRLDAPDGAVVARLSVQGAEFLGRRRISRAPEFQPRIP
jgi:PhnB protein